MLTLSSCNPAPFSPLWPAPPPSWEQRLRDQEAADQRRYQQQRPAEEHAQAALRARLAAVRAEVRRIDRWQWLTAWGFVPAAAVLPSVLLAAVDGWSPLQIAATTLDAILAPGIPTGAALLGVIGAVGCGWWIRRAAPSDLPVFVGVIAMTGTIVATTPRAMPVYTVQARVMETDGSLLAGTLVRIDPGNRVEVLVGNDQFRRGDLLQFSSDPRAYFR